MSFKLLALDLDDTLLDEDFKISSVNRCAIRRAVDMGVLVTLATGRMFQSAAVHARDLQIDLPLITYHGALIRTVGGEETLYHQPIPVGLAKEVAALAESQNLHVNAYINDELFVAEENEFSHYYQNLAKVKVTAVGSLPTFLDTPPTKLTIINRSGRMEEFKNQLIATYSDRLAITISRPYFLEITDRLATKGQALKFLAARHQIPQAQVAAIGDSYNDLDMILYAGIGVAVENARDEVKAVANVITKKNTEHGVAAFIEKYLFKGEGELCHE